MFYDFKSKAQNKNTVEEGEMSKRGENMDE